MTVDIICPVLNGAKYLDEFIQSLRAQTHRDWRLWLRDDGSTDTTVAIMEAAVAADTRIQLLHRGGPPLGLGGAFGWLLERVPPDAAYVMCADADDVWMSAKIERTLSAMLAAERESPGPVLVHTDLIVTDADLHPIHQSFWRHSGIDPTRASLRDLIVRNVVTGCTSMLNRPLRELIGHAPPEARYHDWWHACVASTFGRIVALPEAMILYRQHDANIVGAKAGGPVHLGALPFGTVRALRNTPRLRTYITQSAEQAGAFLARYASRLSSADQAFLAGYAQLPSLPFIRRKLGLIRFQFRPELGLLRNLGVLLRA